MRPSPEEQSPASLLLVLAVRWVYFYLWTSIYRADRHQVKTSRTSPTLLHNNESLDDLLPISCVLHTSFVPQTFREEIQRNQRLVFYRPGHQAAGEIGPAGTWRGCWT